MNIIKAFKAKSKEQPINAYRDIFEQYVTDISFLWVLRSLGVKQPHYSMDDVADLEQRIDANLDGLMNSLDLAWELCLEALEFEQPGEVFTAAMIAFRSHDIDKIKTVVSVGLSNDETVKGLISAMGWLPNNLVQDWIQKFLSSKDLEHKYLAVAACSVRREYPGDVLTDILQREDCLAHNKLHARVLRLIGELKLTNLRGALDDAVNNDDPEVKFWANWSKLLLGELSAIDQLQSYVESPGSLRHIAIQTVFRVLSIEKGRSWISRLAGDPDQARTVIEATGVLGDPHAVPWLIEKMRAVSTVRLAGEAFSMITGINLERYQLTIEAPDDITVVPNNNPQDEEVGMDEDENLPFADINKVARTWQKHGGKYTVGQRYFMGSIIDAQVLQDKLAEGTQRQRYSAALALALLDTQKPLVNVKARSLV